MRTLNLEQLEQLEAGFSWGKCLSGIAGGAIAGFAA